MKIQNRALAGATLALRFHPGQTVKADAWGNFDMPEQDALFLLEIGGGWQPFDAEAHARTLAVVAQHDAAKAASRDREALLQAQRLAQIEAAQLAQQSTTVVKADEKAAQAAHDAAVEAAAQPALPELPPAPPAPPAVEAEPAEGPDLDSADKAALVQIAEEYGVEIDRRWSEQRLREVLDAALYGDETKGIQPWQPMLTISATSTVLSKATPRCLAQRLVVPCK